jgi:hypothetical protein
MHGGLRCDTGSHAFEDHCHSACRTRTKIIIQKRSYLDPGTETFPGENLGNNYAQLPNQRASSVLDNTIFGLSNTQSPLPGPWTLPGKNNPWLQY